MGTDGVNYGVKEGTRKSSSRNGDKQEKKEGVEMPFKISNTPFATKH